MGFMFSLDRIRNQYTVKIRDVLKDAQVGKEAPNPALIDLVTKTKTYLLSHEKAGRPLVVNFGSCTWPPFMANLSKFSDLHRKFAELADFITIYIAEAHPAERNHFSDNYDIDTHATMEQRIEAADTLREAAGEYLKDSPILVDRMDDKASISYGALPERLYVIQDGKISYEGGIGPFFYCVEEVDRFLSKIV